MRHFGKYPLMTPRDAVKLAHQSAKGPGHMVKDRGSALSMLKNEMDSVEANPEARLLEPIGNGYARLDLHAAKAKGIPPEKICDIFIESANSGEKTKIFPLLEILLNSAKEGKAPFTEKELLGFLAEYDGGIVRHSREYKSAYEPAYRVVLEKLWEDLQ